jgi:16S rRNA (cytosine1402-N4)-methyltransferase
MSINEHPPHHVPVLLHNSVELLNPREGEKYLDLTAGCGGHADAFLARTKNYKDACLVDRDEFAHTALARFADSGVRLIHESFVDASRQLIEEGKRFDIVFADLGVSSPQLDIRARGFSFTNNGPLDMRMDQRDTHTAADYVNTARESDIAETIRTYGEESLGTARRYAKAIVAARPIETTGQLAEVILKAHVGSWRKTHPATRTFQAIRIRINRELEQIETLLPLLPRLLTPGGRVGIISFHSLEDRLVKQYFAEQASAGFEAELRLLTKKPMEGTLDDHNPRARSAKLRAAVKI